MSDENRKLRILDEIIAHTTIRTEISHEEWTLTQIMERYHLTKWQTTKIIKHLKEIKAITERPAIYNGYSCTAYKFVDDFDPASLKG